MNIADRIRNAFHSRLSQKARNRLHLFEAVFWTVKYKFPARGMLVIGVTGTKGKTTTSHFVASILEEAGYTVGMATTTTFKVASKTWVNETNKSAIPPKELQALLSEMREARCNALVLEVTSHALDQQRLWGIPFRFAGFTNLTHDHLDYHQTMESYRDTKLKLFKIPRLKVAVVNADADFAPDFLAHTTAPTRMSVSAETDEPLQHATDHLFASRVSANSSSASFTMEHDGESEKVQLKLPGRFNIENALVAAGIALNLNLKLTTIAAGLENLERVPGRVERIETRKGFTVIIDYAHTPDSLEKLYATLRPDVRGRMIAVFGCTGDRDTTKRSIMGSIAARFCDQVILTEDEPYTEDSNAIINEIAKGVPRGRTLFKASREQVLKQPKPSVLKQPEDETGEGTWWWKIPDRGEAIKTAILKGKLDDVILITGMGAQTRRMVGTELQPWSDRDVILNVLNEANLSI
ncbi:UDP-N-acetylmuramoyl-L-alanyl-D-glutamate--2,6-diaminopimelate ligase [soil metagenome]